MKSRIVIEGPRVHDVGYRPFLLQYAQINGFANFFAMNALRGGRQQVLITLQESDVIIEEFLSYLSSNKPDFAEVTSVHVEEYAGEVVPIGTYLQDLQFEQLCKGIPAIIRIEETQKEMLDKQDQMLDKQDQMLDKQDQMVSSQHEMIALHHDTVDEIKGLRKDSAHYLEEEFTEIKKRLNSIEIALNKMGIEV